VDTTEGDDKTGMLDYGYRSKCCEAPIRMGQKKIRKTNQIVKVWICCECKTKDVDIIPFSGIQSQSTSRARILKSG